MSCLPILRRCFFAALAFASTCAPSRAADEIARVVNFSLRGPVGAGADVMIAGFVVHGTEATPILIRAVGPGLRDHGVGGILETPKLQLFDQTGVAVIANEQWDASLKGVFAHIGAFPLADDSRDAAIHLPLVPGAYTAQISGLSNTTGNALIEVYNVDGPARLMNISTRARLPQGEVLITGFVIAAGNGARRMLIRAAGPALESLNVSGFLADPAIAVIDHRGTAIASNDNWHDGGLAPALSAVTSAAGAFPFAAGARDSALLMDLVPGIYTIHLAGVGGASGIALVELYDVTPPAGAPAINVQATTGATDSAARPGVFTLTRSGDTSGPLTVAYMLGGDAASGVDFAALTGVAAFPAGASSITVEISPQGLGRGLDARMARLTLVPGANYNVGTAALAEITLLYSPGSLYLSRLRPANGAAGSTAYGTLTLQLSGDEQTAIVNFSVANLGSPQTNAYLRIGDVTDPAAPSVMRLPNGQVSGVLWQLGTGGFTVAETVEAIKTGRLFITVETAGFPQGELTGTLIRGTGSQTFTPPPAPPPVDLNAISPADAARFLTQATFGPRRDDIDALQAKGYAAWLDEEMAKPASLHRAGTMADYTVTPPRDSNQPSGIAPKPNGSNRQAAWFKNALEGDDQLRQRVAFALSQIYVISDTDTAINQWQEAAAHYYDILVQHAFGNFRSLLREVTLNPMMGAYLSHLRNAKTDVKTGAMPDENYAREIMQLFSIGLNELLPDGTLRLNADGQPIPTYDQKTVTETARVFTGLSYHSTWARPVFRSGPANFYAPMMMYPEFHDDGEKTIVGGRVLPAGQGGDRDLEDTIDALFHHPNTPPFISRQLIQRLVTSNPSPGYVYRVAGVFADNGQGVRGDLGAVVRAILLDPEARSPHLLANPSYGKLKEPLLRLTALMREGRAFATAGRFYNPTPEDTLAQAALRAPTVFNFFEPDYVNPGGLAEAGLYAPEFQILNDTTAISVPNHFHAYIFTSNPANRDIQLNLGGLVALVPDPAALLDRLSLVFTSGQMRAATRDRILQALTQLPAAATATERARTALYLTVTSPDAAIQR